MVAKTRKGQEEKGEGVANKPRLAITIPVNMIARKAKKLDHPRQRTIPELEEDTKNEE